VPKKIKIGLKKKIDPYAVIDAAVESAVKYAVMKNNKWTESEHHIDEKSEAILIQQTVNMVSIYLEEEGYTLQ
jgi:DNA-directed RNA polymerase subunit L